MANPTAFSATYADFKIVKGRKQAQFVLEVPLEQADAALRVLGGLPRPDQERWVAVAVLGMKAVEKPKKSWGELSYSQQAAIACNDPMFQAWTKSKTAEECADYVRRECGVLSRRELDTNDMAARRWADLHWNFRQETGKETEAR